MITAAFVIVVALMALSGLRTLKDSAAQRRLDREAEEFHARMRDL